MPTATQDNGVGRGLPPEAQSPPSNAGRRRPSGARPAPLALQSSPKSSSGLPSASASASRVASSSSTATSQTLGFPFIHTDSPYALDALIDAEQHFTISPESSPRATNFAGAQPLPLAATPPLSPPTTPAAVKLTSPRRGRTVAPSTKQGSRESSQGRSHTMPETPKSTFSVSRPSTPGVGSPTNPARTKPKPSRLNTANLIPSISLVTSPTRAMSPGMKHWQQVRQHVMAPTPVDERSVATVAALPPSNGKNHGGKKLGMVSKAAGRFGFRHAAEHVMGYGNHRRASASAGMGDLGGLTPEEREQVARERRRFARDLKTCLDACALEESRRRLRRIAKTSNIGASFGTAGPSGTSQKAKSDHHLHYSENKSSAMSMHLSQQTAQGINFDPEFSAFAPLLTELHRHLPAARAKKLWSRTCPHHAAILAELGVNFLPDTASTDGERQQALEVFGTVVRNWAPDSPDEELGRWLWLCRALLVDDKQLRNRGLALLSSSLHRDHSLPMGHNRPHTVSEFQSLAIALIVLLYALDKSSNMNDHHQDLVSGLLADLSEGDIIQVDENSILDLIGTIELHNSPAGVEKELIWLAVSRTLTTDSHLAAWLLDHDAAVLKRFVPPPILHATPPIVLRLRTLSAVQFLSSFSHLIRSSENTAINTSVCDAATNFVIKDVTLIPDDNSDAMASVASFLLDIELGEHTTPAVIDSIDPFDVPDDHGGRAMTTQREKLLQLVSSHKIVVDEAAKKMVLSYPLPQVINAIRSFLESDLAPLGRSCVSPLLKRIAVSPPSVISIQPFLGWLSSYHAPLFYKPLFACAAATQTSSLADPLQVVIATADLLGPDRFWTQADSQMVVIVLVGDIAPRQSKGKGKEGVKAIINVKLGRYAVIVELIHALSAIQVSPGPSLRAFLISIETRLGVVFEVEEKECSLPQGYRALVCQLFDRLRSLTNLVRKSAWIRMIVSWYTQDQTIPSVEVQLAEIKNLYTKVLDGSAPRRSILDVNTISALTSLLVKIHASLTTEDWISILVRLWTSYGKEPMEQTTFLLMKCAEIIPDRFRDLFMANLASDDPSIRSSALYKLARLYGYRFQVLSQRTITDGHAPVFQYNIRTLEFVTTDIGSAVWVRPREVQDAALQKYGRSLPLELRQRLMELGWSEDTTLAGPSEWELIPVTALPPITTTGLENSTKGGVTRSPSPGLVRQASSGSGHSFSNKRRRAVVPPILLVLVNEQARLLVSEADAAVGALSLELVRLYQREDSALFIRPAADKFRTDFVTALSNLNAAAVSPTPSYAYYAFNALVGFLKTSLRAESAFPHWALALTTLTRLVPFVAELTLRDVRKNKAEQILLPASIHEDEAGFKLHQPWRDNSFDVQTAQLLLLAEILRANPRDVYLVKKMLFNLQVQASFRHLPFARAWLSLVIVVFSTVNRNYNDRAELRHFLHNIVAVLLLHDTRDLIVATLAMRALGLCSARFRRPFSSVGFGTVMRGVYETYARGNPAVKDCIEYTCRSFYRIHKDMFVYQTYFCIADDPFDPAAAYDLIACLSASNTPFSGIPSGVRGLNDAEELEAIVQMISGPEIALSEIGTAAAERQAHKAATVSLEETVFPRENIVKLLVTVIAANAASTRAIKFLRLFTRLVPHFVDTASQELLREAVEALGKLIMRGRASDDTAMQAFQPGDDGSTPPDWTAARREYIFLVESFACAGGQLGAQATRLTLDIVLDLLHNHPESVGPAASAILGALARTHLKSPKPIPFLRDIAPLFRVFIAQVDFSGVLDSITDLVKRSSYDLDPELTAYVVHDFVEPAIRMLALAAEDSMAFIVPLRKSAVELLYASLFLRDDDALGVLEHVAPSPSLLASVFLPLCLLLEPPRDVDRDAAYASIWIRILRCILHPNIVAGRRPLRALRHSHIDTPQALAATAVLSLQIIKIIIIRAPEPISRVRGLWTYISTDILATIADADGRFAEPASGGSAPVSPRIVDWMMWSLFELLALHRSPLHIDLRLRVQTSLAAIHSAGDRSRPSSASSDRPRFPSGPARSLSGLVRKPSARVPSFAVPRSSSPIGSPDPAATNLSHTLTAPSHSRSPSQHLSPSGMHARMPSLGTSPGRPSFADLSARRGSRPVFDAFPGGVGHNFRFPSSAPVRSLPGTGERGGAIVHLLGPPTQILSATSTGFPTLEPGAISTHVSGTDASGVSPAARPRRSRTREAVRDIRITSAELLSSIRQAVRTTMMVYGYELDADEDEAPVRIWSVHDALHVISEQTRLLVEVEFRDVFNPPRLDWTPKDLSRTLELDEKSHVFDEDTDVYYDLDRNSSPIENDDDDDYNHDSNQLLSKTTGLGLPLLSITSA